MSPFELDAMAALLRQGRWPDAASRGLAAAALLWLMLDVALAAAPLDIAVRALLAAVLVLALAQGYCAIRIGFDAELLAALARQARADGADAAATLDAALQRLRLLPAGKAGRDWPARWRGARGWLRRQGVLLGLQALALVAAWWRAG
ncbi:hypothetical protein LDO32_10085 [Luteimonas sp. Y-2-2-4F]|nr:hypothetical protein [Luteimonas sp. Y-2-2-4F]MCD9032069.1 hypothetical protein [Luteimonas sp. Y-2-2-4F]